MAVFAGLEDARALSNAPPVRLGGVSAGELAAYAARENTVSDLRIERALRESAGARSVYHRYLVGRSLAHSILAAAASGETISSRNVGDHRLELVEDAGTRFLLVYVDPPDAAVTYLEVRAPDSEAARIALGAPIDGIFQLVIDPRFADLLRVEALLQRPDSAVFLL